MYIPRGKKEVVSSSLKTTSTKGRFLRRAGVAYVQIFPSFFHFIPFPLFMEVKKFKYRRERANKRRGTREGRRGKNGERRRIQSWKGKERDGRIKATGRKTRKVKRKERERERVRDSAGEHRNRLSRTGRHLAVSTVTRNTWAQIEITCWLAFSFIASIAFRYLQAVNFRFPNKKIRGKTPPESLAFLVHYPILPRKISVRKGRRIGIKHSDIPDDVRMNVSRGAGDVINQKAAFFLPANKGETLKDFRRDLSFPRGMQFNGSRKRATCLLFKSNNDRYVIARVTTLHVASCVRDSEGYFHSVC